MEEQEKNQIKVLKEQEEEQLSNEQLDSVEGGDCTCDCLMGNENTSGTSGKGSQNQHFKPMG